MRSARKRWPCVDIAIRSHARSLGGLHDLGRRDRPCASIASRRRRPRPAARRAACSRYCAVGLHLLGLAQLQLVEVARGPAVGDVDEQQLGAGQLRQLARRARGSLRRPGVLERRRECACTWQRQPLQARTSDSSSQHVQRDDDRRRRATRAPSARRGLTNSPIFARSLVNMTSGNTAKDSCRLRMTWLRISSAPVPRSPYSAMTMTAGMIAISRVISRRSHGRQPDVEEAFHHDLAGQRAGERRVLARAEQRHREQRARQRRAEQRRQQLVGVADLGDVLVAACRGTSPPPRSGWRR